MVACKPSIQYEKLNTQLFVSLERFYCNIQVLEMKNAFECYFHEKTKTKKNMCMYVYTCGNYIYIQHIVCIAVFDKRE